MVKQHILNSIFSVQPVTCKRVKCESWNYEYAECQVTAANEISQVTVQNKLSHSDCIHQYEGPAPKGYTKGDPGIYGYSGNTVWVHRGCRAWFNVCMSGIYFVFYKKKTNQGELIHFHRKATYSAFLIPFWKGIYSKRKEFVPLGEQILSF